MRTSAAGVSGADVRVGRRSVGPGWDVVAVARREERLRALAEETGCDFVVADLTDAADVDRLAGDVRAGGPLTTLVNNAGGARGLDTVEGGSVDDWRWMFEANVI